MPLPLFLPAGALLVGGGWWVYDQDSADSLPPPDPEGQDAPQSQTQLDAAKDVASAWNDVTSTLGDWAGTTAPNWQKGPPYLYKPGAAATVELFEQACLAAGVDQAWAADPSFKALLASESGGWIGRPNYLYGSISSTSRAQEWPALWPTLRAGNWPAIKSRAIGIGQFIPAAIKKYYPDGYNGIGDPYNETVGMMKYVANRYGDPTKAWIFHQDHNWY